MRRCVVKWSIVFRRCDCGLTLSDVHYAPQLVSLERHPNGYIHSLYGSTSLFLFPRVDRVILSIDVAAGSFTYASKQAVMSELGVRSEDEFLDLSLLAGWDHGPTFPPLVDGTLAPMPAPSTSKEAANSQQSHRPVNLRQILDLIRQHRGTAMGVIHAFSEHAGVRAQGFIDLFAKSKAIIKTSMVVRPEDGGVVPMNLALNDASIPNGNAGNAVNGNSSAEVPSDLHDVFSYRLPDEVFLHLSRGMITPHVYTWLTSGYLTVPAPLDNGETIEYRRFVSDILTESPTSPHCLALAVAASSLHSFWQSRKVLASYWWQPQAERPIPFDSKSTQQLVTRAHQWNVPGTFIDEVLRSTGSNTIDIALCLSATKTSELGQRTITPKEAGKQPLVKKSEIGANVVWRFLELRDFLSSDHLHKPYARALHLALRDAKINDKTQEPLYLALELIREGALTANFYTSPGPDAGPQTFSGGPSYGEKEDEKRWLLLIMRSMSLLPMQYKGTAWTAPVSREMLVFNSFSRALGRSLRHLVETIASSMMLQSEAVRGGVDYLNVAFSLPFQTDADTGLGVVTKCYIEAFIAFHGQPPTEEEHVSGQTKDSKEGVLEMLDGTFGNVRDVRGEIKRGFRYWESLMVAVRLLVERDSIGQAAAKDFEDADRWLKPFRL